MRDKVVVITGASRGIGFEAARRLAEAGANIVVVCRELLRGEAARDEVAKSASGPLPRLLLVDLSWQESIRNLAKEVAKRFDRVDVLLNNATEISARRNLTVDGIERTFAVNHLAPFLLTKLLLDRVCAAPSGRVVTVASEDHAKTLDFANLQGEKRYNFLNAYRQSKLANILFTYELARRVNGTRVTANCGSPGPARTNIGRNMDGLPGLFPRVILRLPFFTVSPEEGARTSIHLASAPQLARVLGRFFRRMMERETAPISYNRGVTERLWDLSAKLTGLLAKGAA